MKSYMLMLFAVIGLAAVMGCATSKDIERVEGQVSSVRADLRTVKGGVEEANFALQAETNRSKEALAQLDAIGKEQARGLKALADDVAVVKQNQADMGSRMFSMAGGEMNSMGGQVDELKHGLETTNAKLDAVKALLQQQMAVLEKLSAEAEKADTATPEAGNSQAEAAQPPAGDPIQMYQSAYLDYTKGNYDVAITGFRDYLKAYPDAEFAGNAQYWIGESLYSLGRYQDALVEFDKVAQGYPDSSKVPGAMLKKGYCYEAMKMPAEAKAVYDVLMSKYPNSEAAKLAADRLKPKSRGKVRGR